MLQNMSVQGCTQHSRSTRVLPTKCCCEHTHVCCRNQTCTQGSKFYQGFADQLLLSAYTCVSQNGALGVPPKDQGLQGFARPFVAASIHMCVPKQIKSGLHPRVDMLQGSGRQGAAVSVLQNNNKTQGFTQGSTVTKVWPTKCY